MQSDYYSKELQKGAEWLRPQMCDLINRYKNNEISIENIYGDIYPGISGFFVLWKLGDPIADEFIQIINSGNEFISDTFFEDVHELSYLIKMGVNLTDEFKESIKYYIKDRQTVRGYIQSNFIDHAGPMRVLVLTEPDSEPTQMAIRYFLDKYRIDYEVSEYEIEEVSVGILALNEYNAPIYADLIKNLTSKLETLVFKDGRIIDRHFIDTCMALQAFSRTMDLQAEINKEGIKWLKSTQESDGSWHQNMIYTTQALESLICLGEGPKVSLEELEKKDLFYKQKLINANPEIVTTNPFLGGIDIHIRIKGMINSASNRLYICSRFITEFHGEIIKLKKDYPDMDLKIITIDSPQAQNYKGDGKKFVKPMFDILQRSLEGCFKTTPLLHARCIISDNAILISSADLTSEQLKSEFNMGFYIRDPKTVEAGAKIFMDLWNNI